MAVDINWGGLAPGVDAFGNYMRGQQIGDERRTREATRTAFGMYDSDPEGAIRALMPYDPQTALSLRKMRREDEATQARRDISARYAKGDKAGAREAAIASGDFDLAESIAKLDENQRKLAQENAEALGGIAFSLSELPYEQRKPALLAQREALLAQGFSPEQLDGFDPTDENIQVVIGQALDLKDALDQADKDRKFKADREDEQFDRGIKREQVGIQRRNSDISASNAARGWAAHRAREAAGGYGTPGVGTTFIPDEDVEIDP